MFKFFNHLLILGTLSDTWRYTNKMLFTYYLPLLNFLSPSYFFDQKKISTCRLAETLRNNICYRRTSPSCSLHPIFLYPHFRTTKDEGQNVNQFRRKYFICLDGARNLSEADLLEKSATLLIHDW